MLPLIVEFPRGDASFKVLEVKHCWCSFAFQTEFSERNLRASFESVGTESILNEIH
jgi:hypothetical protein